MDEKDITFVARRYRKGRFSVNAGWRRLGIVGSQSWRYMRVAAAVAAMVVLTATAALIYHQYAWEPTETVVEQPAERQGIDVVKVIDFENTPLTFVVEKIEEVYGVEVTNVPDNADEYNLSLHYEGNAVDLVMTINDILGTQMQVEQ